jgi:lipopolysaccharide/colanic/teichoic acid biosynthesis glycosyltransferase
MYYADIAVYARRHNIKPGITGLAQIHGCRGATETLAQMEDRVRFDLEYMQNWSFLLDFKIMLMTAFSRKSYVNAF